MKCMTCSKELKATSQIYAEQSVSVCYLCYHMHKNGLVDLNKVEPSKEELPNEAE